jgi:acetylcholinesterase
VVAGDCDDEGTLFALSQLNITTSGQAMGWIRDNYLSEGTDQELSRLAELYPADPTQGSPFGTGYLNQLSPQFKRLAALQGDLVFQAPRRFFMGRVAETQPVWGFNYKRGKTTAWFGAFHGSELET